METNTAPHELGSPSTGGKFAQGALPVIPPPNRKAACIGRILHDRIGSMPVPRTLVVGCGSGTEAAVLAWMLDSNVTGVDNNPQFDMSAANWADLRQGDATALEFHDQSFDLVYSYHALEHIPQWKSALLEMKRVLKPNGWCCIGTPNRSRAIGYLGAENTSVREKILWNYDDWRLRLRGRFRNEFGAHAGFSETELRDMLSGVFASVTSITRDYYRHLYPKLGWMLTMLWASHSYNFAVPAIYFLCRRPQDLN